MNRFCDNSMLLVGFMHGLCEFVNRVREIRLFVLPYRLARGGLIYGYIGVTFLLHRSFHYSVICHHSSIINHMSKLRPKKAH